MGKLIDAVCEELSAATESEENELPTFQGSCHHLTGYLCLKNSICATKVLVQKNNARVRILLRVPMGLARTGF